MQPVIKDLFPYKAVCMIYSEKNLIHFEIIPGDLVYDPVRSFRLGQIIMVFSHFIQSVFGIIVQISF